MPRSMLISRKRQQPNNQNNQQQDQSVTSTNANEASPSQQSPIEIGGLKRGMSCEKFIPCKGAEMRKLSEHFTVENDAINSSFCRPHSPSFSSSSSSGLDEHEEDEDDEQSIILDQKVPMVQQSLQPMQLSSGVQILPQLADATIAEPEQPVDTLTNAITFFLSLLNQQQQQQQLDSQTVQNTSSSFTETINSGNNHQPVQTNAKRAHPGKSKSANKRPCSSSNLLAQHSKESSLLLNGQTATLLPESRQLQQQVKQSRKQQLAVQAAILEHQLPQHSQEQTLFLSNHHELLSTDHQLSNQSYHSKRSFAGSGSGSGSGSDDTFVHFCVDCGKRYSTSSNLARHRQTHRDVTDKKAKKCPECDKIYVSMPAFSMHLRTHNQGCICSICGKSFSRPWLLQGHMRTHTGEKPFRCRICNKAFADKSNLRAHIQTHSTTKPFVCKRCNKAFALKSYLCKHEDSTCMRANGNQKEPLNLKVLNHTRRNRAGQ